MSKWPPRAHLAPRAHYVFDHHLAYYCPVSTTRTLSRKGLTEELSLVAPRSQDVACGAL
jgi:hypothetical protein